jgi:hypothetical protein
MGQNAQKPARALRKDSRKEENVGWLRGTARKGAGGLVIPSPPARGQPTSSVSPGKAAKAWSNRDHFVSGLCENSTALAAPKTCAARRAKMILADGPRGLINNTKGIAFNQSLILRL